MAIKHLYLDESQRVPLLRDREDAKNHGVDTLETFNTYPQQHIPDSSHDAKVSFIGTATTVIEWQDFRIMTDPKSYTLATKSILGQASARHAAPSRRQNLTSCLL